MILSEKCSCDYVWAPKDVRSKSEDTDKVTWEWFNECGSYVYILNYDYD